VLEIEMMGVWVCERERERQREREREREVREVVTTSSLKYSV
jgi:hypothetical protein